MSARSLVFSYTHLLLTLMYIVPIAWLYVALMMAVAEAGNSNGTVLGAVITFLLYGVLPVSLLMYVMATPGRKRARAERERLAAATATEAAAPQGSATSAPDTGSQSATDPLTAERKIP